jgi:AcrR family transcriptional regulator
MDGIAYPIFQDRGRLTVDRLLDAAEYVLEHDGLDATTVPAIAAAADLAVGTVYKRFPDKDALMRAVYIRYFTRARERGTVALAPALWSEHTALRLVAILVPGIVEAYRRDRRLYRGLFQFAQSHPDATFRAQAEQLAYDALQPVVVLLLARRPELAHADPDAAVDFALRLVLTAARGLVMSDLPPKASPVADPVRLAAELRRIVLDYLGITYPPTTASAARVTDPPRRDPSQR